MLEKGDKRTVPLSSKVSMVEKKKFVLVMVFILVVAFSFGACGGEAPESSGQGSAGNKEEGAKEVPSEKTGKWLKIKKKAEADGKKHDVEFRVKSIITDEKKVKKEIDAFNVSGTNERIDLDIGNENLQYCVANYEVKFPDSFPDQDFGLTDVTVDFKITAPDGSEEIRNDGTVYPNLTDTKQIGSIPQGYDFYSGQTYKGKIVYAMVKGCKEYRLKAGKYYIKP